MPDRPEAERERLPRGVPRLRVLLRGQDAPFDVDPLGGKLAEKLECPLEKPPDPVRRSAGPDRRQEVVDASVVEVDARPRGVGQDEMLDQVRPTSCCGRLVGSADAERDPCDERSRILGCEPGDVTERPADDLVPDLILSAAQRSPTAKNTATTTA